MDLAYELHDLVRTLDRHAERMLRSEGLSYNRYVALVIISEHPGLTGRQLAGAVGVSEPAMSGILRQLLGAGLIANVAPAGTGNVRSFELTTAGAAARARATALLGDTLARSTRRIGVDPVGLAATIRAIHDEVEGPAATPDSPSGKEPRP